ncbi:MAG: hypothetical protein IH608_00605 [Proteobacteria bacterium]|nr:hypothetical protein [Pseudomonadota bacterium]
MTQDPAEPQVPEKDTDPDLSAVGEVSIQRIQILNVCLVGLAVAAGFLISIRFAAGVAAGGVLMAANFRVIAGVIRSVFLKQSSTILNAGLYWVKFLALMGFVGLLMLWLRVDVFGFLLGLSIFLVAITLEAVLRLAGR